MTPVQCSKLGAQLFDKFLENGLRTIVGGMLDHELFLELQLPANGGPKSKDPTLGLGFYFHNHYRRFRILDISCIFQ